MSKQTFTIEVTRAEFLKLPMSIRRKALKKQAVKIIKDCPGCAGTDARHSVYCPAYEPN